MSDKGHPYRGVLYAGLMLTEDGPQLIEYNARFGDPECQVLMLRMESDIVPALMSAARRDLSDVGLDWSDDVAMTVVMAAKGYPGSYEKNTLIEGLDAAEQNGAVVFHAGTKAEAGDILATGGRVLNVTARGAASHRPNKTPMPPLIKSTGLAASTGQILAGAKWPARKNLNSRRRLQKIQHRISVAAFLQHNKSW